MRTFGVEEEMLLVDASTMAPMPVAEQIIQSIGPLKPDAMRVSAELQREQLELITAPQRTFSAQLRSIRSSRAAVDEAAQRLGARLAAIGTAPDLEWPHLYPDDRYERVSAQFQRTTDRHLTNGFHVHVAIGSRDEGVAVIDRIRPWLHALLALSANSPFWRARDSGYASYRYQAWSQWPTSGPTEVFGSVAAYDEHRAALLRTSVPLDRGMLYFDARLCDRFPTVEIRVADVCTDATHAAAIAALVRALVETCARDWHRGLDPDPVSGAVLRLWAWHASRYGVTGELADPLTGRMVPARAAVDRLLATVRPVLVDLGEWAEVRAVIEEIIRVGGGASLQRAALGRAGDLASMTRELVDATTARCTTREWSAVEDPPAPVVALRGRRPGAGRTRSA